MKELSIEEKAKAYDEAIEKSKEFYILCKKCGAKDTVDFLEDSFPELKESEDEKIRKVLKHYLEVRRCQTQSDEEYINCNNFLAWLEKQGTYTKRDVDNAYVEGMAFAKDELEKQKHAWSEEDENGLGDALWCCKQAASIAKDKNDVGNVWYAEHWLKSLKERYTWKPSLSQLNALGVVAKGNAPDDIEEINSLYSDLKKLKGE